MDQWAPEDVEAHIALQHRVSELLEENGEYVDAPALVATRTWVRYGGSDAAPVTTDSPLPETNDLVAGGRCCSGGWHETTGNDACLGPTLNSITQNTTHTAMTCALAQAIQSWGSKYQRVALQGVEQ